MKLKILIGVLLILFGGIGLVINGFHSALEKKDVAVNSMQMPQSDTSTTRIREILNSVVLLGGVGLIIWGARGK
ncbi:MAG TPA: hypothetical protein VME86_10945 [Acidobacteriaceae bacterium]|nr:hypothetical protein [Acidobacteriaceae bacterium]